MRTFYTVMIFAVTMVFSSGALAQTLKILKVYPNESKVLVDQGASSGLNQDTLIDLLSESGKELKGIVTKSTANKAIMRVSPKAMKYFAPGNVFTFAPAQTKTSGRRRGAKSKAHKTPFVELDANPAGLLMSTLDFGLHFRIMNNVTLGVVGIMYTSDSVKGSGYGAEARYYFERAFTSWFVALGAASESATLSDSVNAPGQSVTTKPLDMYGLAGYHWDFTENFHAIFGGGVRYYSAPAKITKTDVIPNLEFSNPLSGVGFVLRASLAVAF